MDKRNEAQRMVVGVSLMLMKGKESRCEGRRWFDGESSGQDNNEEAATRPDVNKAAGIAPQNNNIFKKKTFSK